MTRLIMCVATVGITGCDLFDSTRDAIDDLTNPSIALGLLIAVEEPEDADLGATDLEVGTSFSMFLGDAASAADIENAPINNATVTVEGVATADPEEGVYVITPDRGLIYDDGATWLVDITLPSGPASATLQLPVAPQFDAVTAHTSAEGLSIDLAGQGFNAVVVVVIETSSGELTYSTEPTTPREVYDLTRGNDEVSVVDVPGEAFPSDNEVYVLGIAGLNHASGAEIEGVNSVLSSASAGKMVFQPISTFPALPN